MRIIHIGHAPLPPAHPDFRRLYSHPGSWVVNLCMAQSSLPELGVELVTHVPGGSAYFRDDSRGFPIHYIPGPDRLRSATLFFFDVLRISRFVRALAPDIVHAHGTEESYALAAQAVGKPSVITAQGCFFVINREMPPKCISRERIVQFTEWLAFKRAKHVIAKSPYIKNELARAFPHLTLHEIPNTFDPSLLEIPWPDNRKGIAFVGTITPRKGLDCLADALELLKTESIPQVASLELEQQDSPLRASTFNFPPSAIPLTLHIIGNESKNPAPYEQSIISRLRTILGENLILHGRVPAIDAASLVSECEILAAPSIEEMFGNQVIEALLVGTWPVVSSGTAMEDNVRRIGTGGVFQNGDPADLAHQILKGQEKIIAWDRMATRLRVDEFLGPRMVAKAHVGLYEQISAKYTD